MRAPGTALFRRFTGRQRTRADSIMSRTFEICVFYRAAEYCSAVHPNVPDHIPYPGDVLFQLRPHARDGNAVVTSVFERHFLQPFRSPPLRDGLYLR